MNINEQYMFEVRKINKAIKATSINKLELKLLKKYKENLILEYARKITEDCLHENCLDDRYYKIKGKEIWVADKETADFRVVICEECGQEIYLIKDENDKWDTSLGNKTIKIKTKQLIK